MPKLVFISYRREDTAGHAGRLRDALATKLPGVEVYMDVDAIPPGVDFKSHIETAIARCDAFLALIGPSWLAPAGISAKRRIDDRSDYVRLEIQTALARNVLVIPILVQGARMPKPSELPASLRQLSTRNALELSNGRWAFDTDRLAAVLANLGRDGGGDLAVTQSRPAEHPERPAKTPDPPPGNLSTQLTSFVGRGGELAELEACVQANRLVTLTGPGGVGKTRLAQQCGTDLQGAFRDGVWFVDLAAVRDASLVPMAVVTALSIPEDPQIPAAEMVTGYLRNRELLLIFDNFEQVLDAAPIVGTYVGFPGVRVLVTSRERLRLRGEREMVLPPLTLPASGRPFDRSEILASEAVRLFVARAQQAVPEFELSDTGVATVARICERLDGLPLAIELAAARVRLLAPAEMLKRLTQRLPLLVGGSRDLPSRQQTLRSTVAWSYELLAPAEAELFRRLSAFVGGFTIDAAEYIADTAEDPLSLVASLLDKSLVSSYDLGGSAARFRMLELVKEFAIEQLEQSGRAGEVHDRHADYYRSMCRSAAEGTLRHDAPTYADRSMERERDNLAAALTWSANHADPEDFMEFAASAATYYLHRGRLNEGVACADRALALPSGSSRAKASLLRSAASLRHLMGDGEGPIRLIDESIRMWRSMGDVVGLADALRLSASLRVDKGAVGEAAALLAEAQHLARSAGDERLQRIIEADLGVVAHAQGRFADSEANFAEVVRLSREARDSHGIGIGLVNQAYAFKLLGDVDRADSLAREGLAVFRSIGELDGGGWALGVLAAILAGVGRLAEARQAATESFRDLWSIHDRRDLPGLLETMAEIDAQAGEVDRGVQLLWAAANLRNEYGIVPTNVEMAEVAATADRLRTEMGQQRYSDADRAAAQIGVEEILAREVDRATALRRPPTT